MAGRSVRVTRWKKFWLYGELVQEAADTGAGRVRGWFPRQCAVEVVDHTDCCSGTWSLLLLYCNPQYLLDQPSNEYNNRKSDEKKKIK